MILLYINHLGRIQMELRRQGAVDCKTVESVLHIPDAADEAGLVQRGDLLAEGAAGVIQIPAAQQHVGGELTALQVLGEGHDADIAAVLNGLVVRDCILSSNNPWFCQSKFLGIATEIPW